jgi:hypothetical protein
LHLDFVFAAVVNPDNPSASGVPNDVAGFAWEAELARPTVNTDRIYRVRSKVT